LARTDAVLVTVPESQGIHRRNREWALPDEAPFAANPDMDNAGLETMIQT